MMNEEDRKKVFWLLKKYSSYTAWKALGDAYAEFAKTYEYAIQHSEETDEDTSEWDRDHFKRILDGQIAFEKGLPLFLEGQRSVFRNTSTGYMKQAEVAIIFVYRIMNPEEFVFDWMTNKDEVVSATKKMRLKIGGLLVATELDEDDAAPLGQQTVFDPFYGPFNIPLQLPGVPTPTDNIVSTGEEIPITGIWEPEWRNSPGLLKSLTGTPAKIEKGCMNYLLAGTLAPQYKDGELAPEIDVTWRLIWADHRYEDGAIPEEEAEYLAETSSAQPELQPNQSRLRGEPNDLVPKTGWWHSPAKPNGQALHYFEAGQHFPDIHSTEYGGVVWGFDPDEQKEPPKK